MLKCHAKTLAWALGLPLFYLISVGRLGWSHSDDGFILGYVWRTMQGEIPYRDFIYVRPPGSIYFHSLWAVWVPADAVYLVGRAVYCLQLMIASLTASWTISQSSDPGSLFNERWRLFAGLAFLLSASALTPFPWHTVDGVFFATLSGGLVLPAARDRPVKLSATWAIAGGLAALAMMCKQSFYPWPLVLIGLLVWGKRYRCAAGVAAGCVMVLAGACALMAYHGMWHEFSIQTTGNLTLRDAFFAGFFPYFKSFSTLGLPALVIALAGKAIAKRSKKNWSPFYNAWILIAVAMFCLARLIEKFETPGMAFLNLWLDQMLWLLSAFGCLMAILKGQRPVAWLGWLALAWCASISWGFMTTALFSFPGLYGAWVFFDGAATDEIKPFQTSAKKKLNLILISLVLIAFSFTRASTLEDWPWKLTCGFEKQSFYQGIQTTRENCEKAKEAEDLVLHLGRERIVFLPSFTSTYMQTGINNPLPLDMLTNTEMGNNYERIGSLLKNKVRFAIVELNSDYIFSGKDENSRFFAPFSKEVRNNFLKIKETSYFEIYENPQWKP